MAEKFVTAVCRIQGFENPDKIGYQLLAPVQKGVRRYLGGGESEGPVFQLIEKKIGGFTSIEEAIKECERLAKEKGYKKVRIVYPQKAPKFKFGHGELYRLFGDFALRIKQRAARKIGFVPGYIVTKLVTGKVRGRSNAKRFAKGTLARKMAVVARA